MMQFLFLFFLVSPQVMSGSFLAVSSMPPTTIPITVHIDFGPAGKPSIERSIQIKNRSTPKEALREIFPIQEGAGCCDPREVSTIDGVGIEPLKNRWWRFTINGSRNVSPYRSRLKAGDHMKWVYFEEAQ
ncbi:MAG: hypothetical protein HY586_05660 [Candidatus Omnitrophica bacterium]|nr:hypothetical protein [Candidatus Omnitrophota bacterium]